MPAPTLPALDETDLHGLAARLVQATSVRLEPIGGGRNSRVYRLTTADGRRYALKAYHRHPADPRDRLGAEFAALSFLWENQVRSIPQPLAVDHAAGCLVCEYVAGDRLPAGAATAADLEAAADFLGLLHAVRARPGAQALPPASEACFSVAAIVANLRGRLQRLGASPALADPAAGLRAFLESELTPGLAQMEAWCRARLEAGGGAFEAELDPAERTLSPSDFGFHNALRRPDGQLVFLDFEYFGWDDPAKMTADVLLHPAMPLPAALRQRFARGLVERLADCPGLAQRLEIVYPLFGLKWCLILLNEFLPEHWARRQFAGAAGQPQPAAQAEQLAKARGLWLRINTEYEHFSYLD